MVSGAALAALYVLCLVVVGFARSRSTVTLVTILTLEAILFYSFHSEGCAGAVKRILGKVEGTWRGMNVCCAQRTKDGVTQ
jgi:hypothetical protein